MSIHTRGNYTLEDFKKLTEGSNCTVYRGFFKGTDCVLKIYKLMEEPLWVELIEQSMRLRYTLSRHIRVPKVLEIGKGDDFYIIEEYLGSTLKDYFKTDEWSYEHIEDLKECIDIISTFPQNIPLDTNPNNFVRNEFGIVSFVDFMPPDPWAFLNNTKMRVSFERCFPQTIQALKRVHVRKKRYYLTKYRIVKLLHYLDITQ